MAQGIHPDVCITKKINAQSKKILEKLDKKPRHTNS